MKTKLKLGALLCAAMMTMSLSSCMKASAAKVFDEASKKSQESFEANGLDLTAKIDAKITVQGQSQDMKINMDIQVPKGKDASQMSAAMKMEMMGQTMDMKMYSDGKDMYMSTAGVTQKQALTDETKKQVTSYTDMALIVLGDVKPKVQKIENKDGQKTLTIEIEGDKLTDALKKSLLKSLDNLGGTGTDYSYKNVKITAVLDKDNNLVSETITADASVTVQSQTTEISMKTDINFNSIGKEVKVEVPEGMDLKNAMETNAGGLGGTTQNGGASN